MNYQSTKGPTHNENETKRSPPLNSDRGRFRQQFLTRDEDHEEEACNHGGDCHSDEQQVRGDGESRSGAEREVFGNDESAEGVEVEGGKH